MFAAYSPARTCTRFRRVRFFGKMVIVNDFGVKTNKRWWTKGGRLYNKSGETVGVISAPMNNSGVGPHC